ncbi:MAG TPA: response regulator, partial [Anaerolineae bacterium]|nr:response regulator [Anaerolineae bacterium]
MSAAKHILVVDDDATIRELIELALTDEGYEIIAARNGAEALAVVGAAPVDLILLDIRMPIMDGWT